MGRYRASGIVHCHLHGGRTRDGCRSIKRSIGRECRRPGGYCPMPVAMLPLLQGVASGASVEKLLGKCKMEFTGVDHGGDSGKENLVMCGLNDGTIVVDRIANVPHVDVIGRFVQDNRVERDIDPR